MTFASLADEIEHFADDLADAVLPKAGPLLRRTVLSAAQAASHGRLMGQTLDAKVTQRGDALTVLPTPAGPWSVLEAGSRKRQWWEPASTGRGAKRIRIGNDVRIRVLHGPIKGKRTWTKAQDEMSEQFFEVAHAEASKLWRSISGS